MQHRFGRLHELVTRRPRRPRHARPRPDPVAQGIVEKEGVTRDEALAFVDAWQRAMRRAFKGGMTPAARRLDRITEVRVERAHDRIAAGQYARQEGDRLMSGRRPARSTHSQVRADRRMGL